MNLLRRIWRDPWGVITDDRVAMMVGTYFLCVSAPREIRGGDTVLGVAYLLGALAMIVTAWRALATPGARRCRR